MCLFNMQIIIQRVFFFIAVAKHLERAKVQQEELILAHDLRVTGHKVGNHACRVALFPWKNLVSHSCCFLSWGNGRQIEASTLTPQPTPLDKYPQSPIPLPPTGNQVLKYMSLKGDTVDSSHASPIPRFSLEAVTKTNPERI